LKESDLHQSKPTRQQAVDQLLSELPTMDRKGLVRLWRNLFDREPSPALRRETLIPILAFRIQVKAFGGLKESTARQLRELADDAGSSSDPSTRTTRPKTGAQYVREYDGKLHQVTVLDCGYEYEGTNYRSLTEITRVITGSKWSGPAFFGLKRKARSIAA
jgi:Protein of unknown function (DUF2924)